MKLTKDSKLKDWMDRDLTFCFKTPEQIVARVSKEVFHLDSIMYKCLEHKYPKAKLRTIVNETKGYLNYSIEEIVNDVMSCLNNETLVIATVSDCMDSDNKIYFKLKNNIPPIEWNNKNRVPIEGIVAYNTDEKCYEGYNGKEYVRLDGTVTLRLVVD